MLLLLSCILDGFLTLNPKPGLEALTALTTLDLSCNRISSIEGLDGQPSTLNPQPSTLNPQPSTHNPTTLNPQPSTHNPQP